MSMERSGRVRRLPSEARRAPRVAAATCALSALLMLVSGLATRAAAASAAPPPIDACGLLSAAEVSSVLGMPVEAGMRHDEGVTSVGAYSSTCIWKVRNARLHANDPTASLGGADFAILNAFSWPSSSAAAGFLRSFRSAADNHEIPMQPVAVDIGDEALWWGDGVAVRRGALSFGVSVVVNSADRAGRRVWEEALARMILPRLHTAGPR